ncbi:MAG: EpsI family protein [Sedimentisphaerales bacterium]|nr:EpsI family protein [Sedimentisphaerales bacterium]
MKTLRNRPIISAAIAAIFLMFLFGLSHRILADKLLSSGEMPPINPDALASFPMEIGLWTGQEAPLDEAIIEATDTDAHISRNYVREGGLEGVAFYVAFGKKARDLMPHRPEVCYVGAGWTRGNTESLELLLEDGTKLSCTIFQFSRGSLIQNKIMILDYYIVDGIFCSDVSLLRSKIWKGSGAVNYTAQIQISAPISSSMDSESVKKTICDFAVKSAPLLRQLLLSFNIKDSEKEQI